MGDQVIQWNGGELPVNGSLTIPQGASGSTYSQLLTLYGSGWSLNPNQGIGITLEIDGLAAQATIFANPTSTHLAFAPGALALTLMPGTYPYSITKNAQTNCDVNDPICLVVQEMEHAGTGGGG